ncbi:hypothetical protein PVK64_10045 [Aliivibrio sp. S4TY2]|uniref:hypothetical protein n=1 Tax=unclassified Aliivibrio TaxID=2645654 RepID=UPI00237A006F|nr:MULTISPECIES: hypothetical protein [unclassified Aliivibrio]MDD9156529.1 hypothetical protein [Aliivibrio sp. S4TY2]MDD9160034.1 hypothetical protein [Aliivibrio sp. S4TY1]MDD9164256.1 hypothetical protein [Aliivibrio sp. S4MY2]MDD9168236.1 hypothetical protein [Aliivibrio sp. S4MY4]MDD9184572.1 hypothetical protein [Aliivibrio sp. S4MY3]
MNFDQNFIDSVRCSEMKIHCLSVRIWQKQINGLELNGHGTITQNKFGTLILEMVCTKTQYEQRESLEPSMKFPKDHLKPEEELFAEFIDISGRAWETQGFKLEISGFQLYENKVIYAPLLYISSEEIREESTDSPYLHFEFEQSIDIPFNKSNRTISTATGSESFGFNELNFEIENIEVRIVNEAEYRFVKASGDFVPKDFELCVRFFLNFSCGVLIQPYILFTNIRNVSQCIIRSFNNQILHKRSTNPIPSNIQIPEGRDNYSIDLLQRFLILQSENIKYFNCLNNQWERVWRGFNSSDDIAELVLSVAVEGILNDIYIPDFKLHRLDEDLVETIKKIKVKLKTLDIEPEHLSRLVSSISYWKNITAAKALDILISESVLGGNDKKLWNKIRNASAHPISKDTNHIEEQQKRDDLYSCIDIFHKLVLNVLAYSGPVTLFSLDYRNAVYWEHQQVLGISS